MQFFSVELDVQGAYSTEIKAESAKEAYEKAVDEILDLDSVKVVSFQVYDEKFQPCDIRD